MKRSASAVWNGSLKEGSGSLTAKSGVLKSTPYSFGRRFGEDPGTNPEELIAAAHAGCYAMALSAELGKAGFTPTQLDATAEVTLENVTPGGWTVTTSHIPLTAKSPNIDAAKFTEIANGAKVGGPSSRLLTAKISLDAKLV